MNILSAPLRWPALLLALLPTLLAQANNIQVGNIIVTDNGTTAQVQFDLGWENSWRVSAAPSNWDAAWVFVKYWNAAGVCSHANLSNTGQVAPAGSQMDLGLLTPGDPYAVTTNPAVGAFIYRNANGTGTFSLTGVQLRWDYGALGLAFSDIVLVQVFAIEMVYVPEGSYYLGSGGWEPGSFTDGSFVSGTSIPFQVTSENAISMGPTAGSLWGRGTDAWWPSSGIGPAGTLPGGFPKGFDAFYCMKYEVTQQGYVDFLNTLTYGQQVIHTAVLPTLSAGTGAMNLGNNDRNGIDIQSPGVASTTPAVYACNLNGNSVYGEAGDGKDIACNYLAWGDLAAYLDWSGLRPMTELEFEKACRGPNTAPMVNDRPWGTNTGGGGFVAWLNNPGTANETIFWQSDPAAPRANCRMNYGLSSTPWGPMRVGIFAGDPNNTGRITAGASYYGIMELGGNAHERMLSVGSLAGRAYTGAHGDGVVPSNGIADPPNWPSWLADGTGYRGGHAFEYSELAAVSARHLASQVVSGRNRNDGGRGVRNAP